MEVFAPLVGVSFRGTEAKELVKSLTPDDGGELSLEAEPDNQYDSNAVKVIHNPTGMFIGYLARENNSEVFNALQDGEELEIKIVSFDNLIKPVFLITKATSCFDEVDNDDQ